MALPLTIDSNPEEHVLTADEWTLVAENVHSVKINNLFPQKNLVFYTYLKTGDTAPIEKDDVPNWRINEAVEDLKDSNTKRDYYVFPVKEDAKVLIEVSGNVSSGSQPIDVVPQSNTSPWNDFYFVQANGTPTFLTSAVPGSIIPPQTVDETRILNVASVANISVGDWLGVFTGSGTPEDLERYYWAEVESINVLELTMDTLIDFPFPANAPVLSTTRNMAVDGSTVPQIFSIQAGGGGGILEIDITRVMLGALTEGTVNLSKFCDIVGGLVRPMYLRVKENGVYRNKISVKDNFHLALLAYDWNPFAAINPQQGQDGMLWRFSINGPDKHDSVSRVSGGNVGSLQWVIQSALQTITTLESVGANSEVTP